MAKPNTTSNPNPIDRIRIENILRDEPGNYYVMAPESERQIFREWVTGVLRQHEAVIDFAKADGAFRSMTCTLEESRLPPAINKTAQKKHNPEVCVVWDCNQQAWRSFRWDRIKRIAFTLG